MEKEITLWERYNDEKKVYEHNHIEFGHVDGDKPKPKFDSQKGWMKGIWRKKFGSLKGLVVLVN